MQCLSEIVEPVPADSTGLQAFKKASVESRLTREQSAWHVAISAGISAPCVLWPKTAARFIQAYSALLQADLGNSPHTHAGESVGDTERPRASRFRPMKWPTRVSVSVGPRQCAFFILDLVANKVKNAVFDLFDRDDNNIAGTFLSGVLVCLR